MGVMTDVQRVPDPDVLASHMVTEFESLLLRCLTMPWPGRFAADVGKAAVTASPRRKRSTAKTPGTETEHTS
jgi:hypothetical protein